MSRFFMIFLPMNPPKMCSLQCKGCKGRDRSFKPFPNCHFNISIGTMIIIYNYIINFWGATLCFTEKKPGPNRWIFPLNPMIEWSNSLIVLRGIEPLGNLGLQEMWWQTNALGPLGDPTSSTQRHRDMAQRLWHMAMAHGKTCIGQCRAFLSGRLFQGLIAQPYNHHP